MSIEVDRSLLGCSAKFSAEELCEILGGREYGGLHEDSGEVLIDESPIRSTIDSIYSVSINPEINGEASIYHAANDLICTGSMPVSACLSVGIDPFMTIDESRDLVSSIKKTLSSNGVYFANGHTYRNHQMVITLSMTGIGNALLKEVQSDESYSLVLTKMLGGALNLYSEEVCKNDLYRGKMEVALLDNPFSLINIQRDYVYSGSTDISGFGLIGHLVMLAKHLERSVVIQSEDILVNQDVADGSERIETVCSAVQNHKDFNRFVKWNANVVDEYLKLLMYCGETNGPILSVVNSNSVDAYIDAVSRVGFDKAHCIGELLFDENEQDTCVTVL